MKTALLLSACALLSTLCAVNARSIMSAANKQDDYDGATLQDLYDTMALQQQEDDDDGNKMAKEQFLPLLASLALPSVIGGVRRLIHRSTQKDATLQQQDDEDYQAELQNLYNSLATMEQEDDDEDDGEKIAKEQIWGALARLALPFASNLIGHRGQVSLQQEDDDEDEGEKIAKEQIWGALARLALPLATNFIGGHRDQVSLQQEDDNENDNGVAEEQRFWRGLLNVGKKILPHVANGLLGGGGYYDAEAQQDDYEARSQDLYDSQAINQQDEEEDDDENDNGDKEAEMQFFKKFRRGLKKFGRKAGRGLKKFGKGALKHGGAFAGHAVGGAIGGALAGRGGGSYYYQDEVAVQDEY